MGNDESNAIKKFKDELDGHFKELTDMAAALGQDCNDQYLAIQSSGSQMYRRAYVRSVFAFIEGVLHRMKRTAAHIGLTLNTLSIAEIVLIDETSFDVDEKGEVIPKPVFIRFQNNVKFSFRVYSKSIGSSFALSLGGVGWRMLKEAVKVRDRLMHPKAVTDLDVTDAEVEAAKKAFDWFFINYALCSNYAQKTTHSNTSLTPEDAVALDMRISKLEATLKSIGG